MQVYTIRDLPLVLWTWSDRSTYTLLKQIVQTNIFLESAFTSTSTRALSQTAALLPRALDGTIIFSRQVYTLRDLPLVLWAWSDRMVYTLLNHKIMRITVLFRFARALPSAAPPFRAAVCACFATVT